MNNNRYSETELLHSEVFMPSFILNTALHLEEIISEYDNTLHFISRYNDKNNYKHYMTQELMTKALKSIQENKPRPFEVEIKYDFVKQKYIVTKYVVRVSYDTSRDVSFAIVPIFDLNTHSFKGRIKTAWLNSKEDVHRTLDDTKYIKQLSY